MYIHIYMIYCTVPSFDQYPEVLIGRLDDMIIAFSGAPIESCSAGCGCCPLIKQGQFKDFFPFFSNAFQNKETLKNTSNILEEQFFLPRKISALNETPTMAACHHRDFSRDWDQDIHRPFMMIVDFSRAKKDSPGPGLWWQLRTHWSPATVLGSAEVPSSPAFYR